MRWIREHRLATATLVAFVALFLLVFVSRQTLGDSNPLGRAAGKALSAVEAPFAAVGGFFNDSFAVLFDRGDLVKENDDLRARVMELEKALTEARLSATDLEELKRLSELLNYSGLREKYDTVAADVIAMDASNVFNIFTINVGTGDGVFMDAVVVDGDGLIGRVMSVGDGWAKVISVIDESNKVGFQVFRSPEWLGVLQGGGDGSLKGYMLDEAAAVREGDRLITSGIGGIYPQGITIGKVVGVTWDHDTPLKTIEVEPAAYFKNIRKVSVLLAARPSEEAP